jgi:NitT/TauT family transport system substrate-binding protein
MKRRDMLLRGCTAASASWPAWGALSACTAPQPPLRVAVNAWIGYALLFLAQDLGLIDKASTRLVEYPSNTASLLALANQEVSAAALTLDEFLLAREGGLDVQVALVFDESNGADAVLGKPELSDLRALKGRRVGVESSAVGALMLSRLLNSAGLQPSDVHKVPLTADQHVAAFEGGQVDAVITFEPMASRLRAVGARLLLDSKSFPGLILDVLAVRPETARQQPAALRRILSAHFQALAHLRQSPDDALRRLVAQQQLPAQAIGMALQGLRLADLADNHRWLAGPRPQLLTSAQAVCQVMQEAHLLNRSPDLSNMCLANFLPEMT